jgi:hypothetical protein
VKVEILNMSPKYKDKTLQPFTFLYFALLGITAAVMDLQHPPSGLIVGKVTWPGSGTVTEIQSALTFAEGSVLTIEAGAVLRFTSASAVLVVKGTLIANGRPGARIVFDGVDMTSRALWIPAIGGVNVHVSYATFSNFSQAVSLEDNVGSKLSLYFEDCVFEGNGAAMEVFYFHGMTLDFVRCEFLSNLRPVSVASNINFGGLTRFDSCYFHSQGSGVVFGYLASGSTVENCVFMNHSGIALSANAQSVIRDSLFVSNDVGIQTHGTVENCIFLMNRVGIAAYNGARIEGGWICSRPLDNSSDLIQVSSPISIEASNVWFGIPGQREAIIRGSIKDGYWWPSSGIVDLIQVSDRPTAWPISLQSFNSSHAPLCSAPQDRGLDLQHPFNGAHTRGIHTLFTVYLSCSNMPTQTFVNTLSGL